MPTELPPTPLERLQEAVAPFLAMMRTFSQRPNPCPESYWQTPVFERNGVVLTTGDFATLAAVRYIDFDASMPSASSRRAAIVQRRD